ncbi:hypothetical protein ABZ372_07640, partial [Streptomyces sp. NPDC005921]
GGFPIRRTVGAVQAVDGLDFQVSEGSTGGRAGVCTTVSAAPPYGAVGLAPGCDGRSTRL